MRMVRSMTSGSIFIAAGEASGDALGAGLMREIRKIEPQTEFSGVGGTLMEEEGLQSLFPMTDLSVMGLAEVLPRLPLLVKRIGQTARRIVELRPDIVVTIDSPDFSFRVAEKVRKLCPSGALPRMIHYVAPTVWAWREERAAKMAALYDGIVCLFPFEPAFFQMEGVDAVFAGHPAIAGRGDEEASAGMRRSLAIPADAKVLGVFFGSRMGELNRTGPVLRRAALKIAEKIPGLHIVTLTFPNLERQVDNLLQGMPCKTHILTDQHLKGGVFSCLDAAMATSGTVGLELAIADVPHVIAYRMNPLTWRMVRRRVSIQYAHLGNILLDAPMIPEFLQGDCRPETIADAVGELLTEDIKAVTQKLMFERIRGLLTGGSGRSPSEIAAAYVLDSHAGPVSKRAGCG